MACGVRVLALLALSAYVGLFPACVSATEVSVSPGGSDSGCSQDPGTPCASLSHAVTVGGHVTVESGVYEAAAATIPSTNDTVTVTCRDTLSCVLRCAAAQSMFFVVSATVTIRGFVIEGCTGTLL